MLRASLFHALLAAALLAHPASSFAQAVVLVSDDRRAYVEDLECLNSSGSCPPTTVTWSSPSTPFETWTGDFHTSSVSTGSMSATADPRGFLDDPYGEGPFDIYGQAQGFWFDVTFDVLEPVALQLSGSWYNWDFNYMGLVLEKDGTTIFDPSPPASWELDFLFDEVLAVGRYQLVAYADAEMSAFGSAAGINFDAAFTPIPEPATAMMVGVALAMLARARRPRALFS